jgi:NitT/TauT family transport system ATP-binding protein
LNLELLSGNKLNFTLSHISKTFGELQVLDNFSIEFIENRINCILGPSGCGKTTLLNIIAGLIPADDGVVNNINNENISYIFQEDRLLPWKTVKENLRYVLRSRFSKNETEDIINKNISLIELENFANYHPHQLSGGMKRRVSIARAFCFPSEIVLLDEPFRGIDISLKYSLMSAIRAMWEKDQRTLIYVTHDIEEAVLMGHLVFVFSNRPAGIIGQFGQPDNRGPGRSLTYEENALKEKIRSLLIS